jgi:hypothetical protein
MWIVRLALSRPYTFVVMSILIAILAAPAGARLGGRSEAFRARLDFGFGPSQDCGETRDAIKGDR